MPCSRWLDRGDPIARLDLPSVAEQVVFSPNGQLIAAVCGDGVVRIWRLLDGVLQQQYAGTPPLCFYMAEDNSSQGQPQEDSKSAKAIVVH
jgi:WD40 repeat protein